MEKRGQRETHILGHDIWQEKLKDMQKRNTHCRTCNMRRNSENVKYEKYTVESWILVKKLTNVENETKARYDLEYGEKH